MKSGDFLIENFRKFIDTIHIFVSSLIMPELKLSQSLVSERCTHDERGMSSGTTEVEKTTLIIKKIPSARRIME